MTHILNKEFTFKELFGSATQELGVGGQVGQNESESKNEKILSFQEYKNKVKKYFNGASEEEYRKAYKEYLENPSTSLAHISK